MNLSALGDAAADLLLGARCASCGRVGRGVCRACRDQVRAGRVIVRGIGGADVTTMVAAGTYQGVVQALLIAAKERQALGLLSTLGERLAVSITVLASAGGADRLVLVPMPSLRSQVARRGLDFTASLARSAAGRLRRRGVRVLVVRCLGYRRRIEDQAGLGVDARRRNLAGAFRLRRRVPPGAVIVVDDIVTTGASLAEAVRVLTAAGRPPLGAATVAATPRRRG